MAVFIESQNILDLKELTRIIKKKFFFISRINVAHPWSQYLPTPWLKEGFPSWYSWFGFHPSVWTLSVSKISPQLCYSLKTQPRCTWVIELPHFREFLHCSWRLLLHNSNSASALRKYNAASWTLCKGLKNENAIPVLGQVDVDSKLWSRQKHLPSSVLWPMR